MEKDRPTYPANGIIFKGDYLENIPFDKYIRRQERPKENVYDIRDFGATPDSAYLCTEAFLKAAEAAARTKGTVLVSGGVYITGSVKLYSDTTLFIEYGSTLKASANLENFRDAFLLVKDVKNVTLTGGGKLSGSGEYFVNLPKEKPLLAPLGYTKLPPRLKDPLGYPEDTIRYAYRTRIRYADDRYLDGSPVIKRPMYTLWVRGSENVKIENFIIEDSLDWTLDVDYSRHVTINNVVINNNRHVANSDGIDVMCSEDVEVNHVFISTADDGLCVKAPLKQGHDGINVEDENMKMGGVKNVRFKDCVVCSVMNAFKIGTETYFDIENVEVEDCEFIMPDLYPGGVSGISIESADSSNIKNIRVKNIKMTGIVCPLFICLNKRNKFGFENNEEAEKRKHGGSIENVSIENVSAINAEIPSLITGYADGKIRRAVKDITIKDFSVEYLDNEERLDIIYPLYENLVDYPESNAFGDLPAYGLFIRHADNVNLENISVKPRSCNTREMIIFDDCK